MYIVFQYVISITQLLKSSSKQLLEVKRSVDSNANKLLSIDTLKSQ